jgi:membrane fusion protein (multidrug efflux system)
MEGRVPFPTQRHIVRPAMTAVLLLVAACGKEQPPAPPPPEVAVQIVRPQAVSHIIELPGRVQAVRTAEVRARVDGIVQRRMYEEGTDIRAGAPLFQIDPSQLRASYQAAQATLSRAQAAATNAGQVVRRYAPLVREQAISSQEYEAAVAQSRQGQADVAQAQAQLARARLDLNYSTVTAPISGRAGRAQVTEGALVSASQATLMTTIEQLDPIYVNFSQSSSELLRLRRESEARADRATNLSRIQVQLNLEDGSRYGPVGHLDFLDMAVDESTGTVSLRAEFPNPQRLLLPGQFVRARVLGAVAQNGISVPQRAVQIGSSGASVLLVGPNNVVVSRPVVLGDLQGDQWVVRSGLKPGDKVIIEGVQKARPGSPVRVAKPAPAPGGLPR